jgi:oligosaccharyltransferase complex subunit beta
MLVETFEKGGEGLWAGSGMGVVSGFVAANGARVVFADGVEMFEEEFVKATIE